MRHIIDKYIAKCRIMGIVVPTFVAENNKVKVTGGDLTKERLIIPEFVNEIGYLQAEHGMGSVDKQTNLAKNQITLEALGYLDKIGVSDFTYCGRITKISIPKGVGEITDYAFIYNSH